MAATVAAATSGSGTNNYAVAVPEGTVDGDLLIAVNASDWSTLASCGVPAGFAALTTAQYDGGTNQVHIALGWRDAASEPGSHEFPGGGGADSSGALLRITGHDTTPVIVEVAPVAVTAGTGAINAPSLTPSGADDLLICIGVVDGANGGGTLTWTIDGAGLTEHVDQQSGDWTSLVVGSLSSPPSPSGARTLVTSPANHNKGAAVAISIKSAAGSGIELALPTAAESDTARPLGAAKTADVATAGEAAQAQALGAHKTLALGTATETDTAQLAGAAKSAALAPVAETSSAQGLGLSKVKALGTATEVDTAVAMPVAGQLVLGLASAIETAQPLGRHKRLALSTATEASTAQSLASGKALAVGTVSETATAGALGAEKIRALGVVSELDIAVAFQQTMSTPTGGRSALLVRTGPDSTPVSRRAAQGHLDQRVAPHGGLLDRAGTTARGGT